MIDFSELLIPTVEVLKEAGHGMHIRDINEQLKDKVPVSREDLKQKHLDSNQTEFAYRAAWARTYLKKYGLLQNPERGYWQISDVYNGEEINPQTVVETVRSLQKYTSDAEAAKGYDIGSENARYLRELQDEYKKGKITLFLGAGVSMAANMPSWDALITNFFIERLKDERGAEVNGCVLEKLTRLASMNSENSPLMQTRFMEQNMEPEKFFELLTSAIYQRPENLENSLFNSLTGLIRNKNKIYIREIVTYNFDDLLERKLDEKDIYCESYDGPSPRKDENSVNIYHVHGKIKKTVEPDDDITTDNIVFSEEQYHNIYTDTYHWSNIKQIDMLREHPCLFIGCSLSDPNTRRLLDIAYKKGETRHYAFMKRDKIKIPDGLSKSEKAYRIFEDFYMRNRNAYYNSLGIHVIWVDEYDEIPELLDEIRSCVG